MKNQLLRVIRDTIPYVKELRSITNSVPGSLLMQQLDYWFARYPNGFYKFLQPSNHPLYKPGKSWIEELGFSLDEFRTAFDKIGHRWNSKSQFENAEDKFLGKFYASYVDKRSNVTYYFRNHELVDAKLDNLISNHQPRDRDSPSPGDGESLSPGDGRSQSLQMGNPSLPFTDTTRDYLQRPLLPTSSNAVSELGSGSNDLYFTNTFSNTERTAILEAVRDLDKDLAQKIVDEIVGLKNQGAVRISAVSLARGLVKKAAQGKFKPAAGLTIEENRKIRMENEARIQFAASIKTSTTNPTVAPAAISKIKELIGAHSR